MGGTGIMEGNLRKRIETAREKLGVRLAQQLFAVPLLLFGVDKKTVIGDLGISRFSIKNMRN
jgi:hypothetical protein